MIQRGSERTDEVFVKKRWKIKSRDKVHGQVVTLLEPNEQTPDEGSHCYV